MNLRLEYEYGDRRVTLHADDAGAVQWEHAIEAFGKLVEVVTHPPIVWTPPGEVTT